MRAASILVSLLLVCLAGCSGAANRDARNIDNLIAFAWGDGKYGEAFYGAQVYYAPAGADGVKVLARVHIGPGNGYFHECGVIGVAKSREEAVRKFGVINFRADGLHVGSGTVEGYFLPREKLEAHR